MQSHAAHSGRATRDGVGTWVDPRRSFLGPLCQPAARVHPTVSETEGSGREE